MRLTDPIAARSPVGLSSFSVGDMPAAKRIAGGVDGVPYAKGVGRDAQSYP